MSTRKLSGRLNTNSPTSSTDSNNTALLTVSQSPTKSSPLSVSPTSLSVKSTTENSNSNPTTETKKRRRRTSVLASPSLSLSSSKKVDDNDETLSSVSDVIADDDKSLKAVNDEEVKDVKDDKEKEISTESPARSRRRKLYENKTATSPMVTRKTTMDSVRNTRSLRCIRRDSQGKLEGFFEIVPPKRPYRRKTNSTPELSTPTKRKKDEISGKDDDEPGVLQKKIKIEKVDPEDDLDKNEDEEYMKDEDEIDKSYLDETLKTELGDSTIEGETDASGLETPSQDSVLHENTVSEATSEEQQEEKLLKESEQSVEVVTEKKAVPVVVPVKVSAPRGRPPRNKQKVIEVKPVVAKKGRKPKAPVERKIQPTRSVTKKGKECKRSAIKKDTKTENAEETKEKEVNAVEEPLTVDTNVAITAAEKETSSSASCSGGETSEKAASLSPDLMSEGVNVQIVKDFYKKPEFLENNQGIEQDPKLGEIVQKVEQKTTSEECSEETEKIPLEDDENKLIIATEDDTDVVNEADNKDGQMKSVDNESQESLEREEIIAEDNVEKPEILDDNSQQSTDMDLFSLKNLNESDGDEKYEVQKKDEGEVSGCVSGDSLKENDILLVLEDSNDEDGSNSNVNENENVAATATENADVKMKKDEIQSQDEVKISKEPSVDDSLTKTQEITISANSATEEDEELEVDLRPICDKINSNNSSTSTSNCSNINSNNDNKAVDENGEEEVVVMAVDDEMAIKDNKVDDDDDSDEKKIEIDIKADNDSSKIVNEDINSQMKAIQQQKQETDGEEEESMKEEEKIEIKDQLNLQIEVDSGISDAVTDTNEDVSMNEINHEKKSECVNVIDDDDDKCGELKPATSASAAGEPSTSSGLGISKKSSKKLKEERDLKKVEKLEQELPLLESKLQETPETLKQKENHLKTLGLLTHKAAVEAKIEKQRRRKQLQSNLISSLASKKNGNSSSSSSSSNSSIASNGSNGGGLHSFNSGGSNCNKNASEEYTGTLKTVIKLNRQGNTANTVNETKRKSLGSGSGNGNGSNGNSSSSGASSSGTEGRQSLKMTFQKGRGRPPNSLKDTKDFPHSGEETTYYTIQNENEGSQHHNSVSHGRKSYNRSHTTVDINHHTSSATTTAASSVATATATTTTATTSTASETQEPSTDKVEENKLILIPEKASSFGIHPGRLCQDQCFYCGGRFGLYDTPCHVAQLKSEERKQKILANEEKLTIDNCLCDACFRHVVRRAKDSSSGANYKPRISAPAALETQGTANNAGAPSTDDCLDVIAQVDVTVIDDASQPTTLWTTNTNKPNCFVPDCMNQSSHSLRRKCIRKTIKKLVPNFDLSKIGATAPICEKHYNTVIQFLGCALCKRRLGKNHMQYINQDSEKLGKLLGEQGIPVKLASNSAVCKLCRYFVNLLLKPPDHGKLQKEQFVKNYRRRLLHFHNIQSAETSDIEEQSSPTENKTESENSKEKPVVEEQVVVTKPKRGRKPKNQAVAAAVAAAIAKASAAVATATSTPSTAAATPVAAASIHAHQHKSSESDKNCSNIGTGSNTPQSSDEGNEKLMQSVAAANSNPVSGQIILDNDVMVDYDMPVPLDTPSPPPIDPPLPPPPPPLPAASSSQQQSSITSKLQSILQSGGGGGGSPASSLSSTPKEDISIVLRSNPNISMRELFPGEEEMGLHMNVPFGGSQSYRTPEGWTRVQTFLQYDESTRRLWENLQKPYGNQSSFLRHLILLEKYYRNGDLVLSHKASENATVYSETVRNRLRSYDHVVVDDNSSFNNSNNNEENDVVDITKSFLDRIPKHVSNLPITITTKPKQQSQSASSNSSGNNHSSNSGSGGANDGNANGSSSRKSSGSGPSAGDSILKSNLLGKKSDSIEILPINSDSSGVGSSSNSSGMTKQQKLLAAASKLMGNGASSGVGGVREGTSTMMSQQISQQQHSFSQQQLQPEPKKSMINNSMNLPPQLISINRDRGQNRVNSVNDRNNSLLSNRRRSTSDHQHHSMSHRRNSKQIPPNVIILPDTLTQAERLQSKNWRPTLMQVSQAAHLRQPGGPLYQTADGRRLPSLVQVQSGGSPYLISIHDYNRMCILRREKIMREQLMKNRNLSQQLAQHNKPPQYMGGRHSDPTTSSGMIGSLGSRNSQHSLKSPPQQTSLLKNSLSSGSGSSGPSMSSMASKLLGPTPSQLQILPQMSTSQHHLNSSSSANSVSIIPSSLSGIVGGGGPLLPPSTVATNVSTSWLWNNINGGPPPNATLSKNILSFTANPSSSASISPMKHSMNNASSLILDNSLLSKIPKSLTVIPQQKSQQRRRSRDCSIDDLTSA